MPHTIICPTFLILSVAMLCTTSILFAQDNESTVLQLGDNATSIVAQHGSSNTAYQYQTSNDGLVDIYQLGSGNYAKQDQGKQWDHQTSFDDSSNGASMEIKQIGDKNSAEQTQTGENGIALIHQTGDTNQAYQYQSVGGNNSTTTQIGNLNWAQSTQNGLGNGSVILQNLNGNSATVMQTGNNHMSNINQSGASNTATVTQHGYTIPSAVVGVGGGE